MFSAKSKTKQKSQVFCKVTRSALSCAQVCKNNVISKDSIKVVIHQESNNLKNRNKVFM